MLVRIVKNWDFPNLLRQTPGDFGVWGDVRFTLEPVEKCDWLIVLNQLYEDIQVECPPQNVWALFQEPYEPDFLPWMRTGHKQFSRIYTHHPPAEHTRYRVFPPLVPWHVDRNYDQLLGSAPPTKHSLISWITSNLQTLRGHKLRSAFLSYLQDQNWGDLDLFGRGIRPIDDKWAALAPYRYSIAVENFSGSDYWTEKVADCWLANVLPFYYGCTNLEAYFPTDSFIRIDLQRPEVAYRTIRQAVDTDEYERRAEAVEEAKQLVLKRYQFFPRISKEIQMSGDPCGLHRIMRLKKYHVGTFRQILSRFSSRCQ